MQVPYYSRGRRIIVIVLIAMELQARKVLCTGVPHSSVLKLIGRKGRRRVERVGESGHGRRWCVCAHAHHRSGHHVVPASLVSYVLCPMSCVPCLVSLMLKLCT